MEKLPTDCWDNGHTVREDMFLYETAKERLFYCEECETILICVEENGDLLLKKRLPINTPRAKVLNFITFEESP